MYPSNRKVFRPSAAIIVFSVAIGLTALAIARNPNSIKGGVARNPNSIKGGVGNIRPHHRLAARSFETIAAITLVLVFLAVLRWGVL